LNRLMKRGAIELVEQSGKKKYYQATERLFNIYYLMRKRGVGDNQVKTTIDFMAIFYPDIFELAVLIAKEIIHLPIGKTEDYSRAISYIEEIAKNKYDETSYWFFNKIIEISYAEIFNKALLRETVKEAIEELLMRLVVSSKLHQEIIEAIIVISTDHADFVLDILIKNYKSSLEPLIVGLKIFLGEERPLVAQEIFEIGKDVADRIRIKQAELAILRLHSP
jgi:predicted nucleic-acid-binding protein